MRASLCPGHSTPNRAMSPTPEISPVSINRKMSCLQMNKLGVLGSWSQWTAETPWGLSVNRTHFKCALATKAAEDRRTPNPGYFCSRKYRWLVETLRVTRYSLFWIVGEIPAALH